MCEMPVMAGRDWARAAGGGEEKGGEGEMSGDVGLVHGMDPGSWVFYAGRLRVRLWVSNACREVRWTYGVPTGTTKERCSVRARVVESLLQS